MPTIHILGLGAGDFKQLPLGVYEMIKETKPLYLRTKEHPVVEELDRQGITYRSFDDIYQKHEQFEAVYEEIVSILFHEAKENKAIVYAVPGHPIVAEKTVQLLLDRAPAEQVDTPIGGGQSFIDPLLGRLHIDPVQGLVFLDALSFKVKDLLPESHIIFTQLYDPFIASEVKLTLMELYPDDYLVTVATAVGTKQEHIQTIPLYELDRVTEVNNLTALYVPPAQDEKVLNRQFYRSRQIFRELRGPNGCPWDKEQTHESLTTYMLEEAQEVVEAIQEGDIDHLIEELGDVLLQVFLHAQIGEDEGYFSMEDVIQSLNEKMIRRHPHVFGEQPLAEATDVLKQWERIKANEREKKKGQNREK